MKKIAFAAALVAGFAGSAFAQSSVTVYGRVNTSVERQKNISGVDQSQTLLANNASRIGFKGTEALGGGLKANFLLEHRFNSDDGRNTNPAALWSGDSWVGLSGNFGELRLGNITSAAYFATADYVSLHNHDTGTSADALYDGLGLVAPGYAGGISRQANTIAYITPNFGGLTVEGQFRLKEGLADNQWELAANYDLGGLHLGAGFTKLADAKSLALRALYELGSFTFGGYYERTAGDDATGTSLKRNNFRLSAMYTLGASEFHANVGVAGDRNSVKNTGAKQFTLGYNYNLSKRTKVYTYYTKVSNESGAAYGTPAAVGVDPSAFAVGVRHAF